MKTVTIHEAKTNLSKLLAAVETGEEIVIARKDKPVAKIVPLCENERTRKPGFGSMKGLIEVGDEALEPMPEDEINPWYK